MSAFNNNEGSNMKIEALTIPGRWVNMQIGRRLLLPLDTISGSMRSDYDVKSFLQSSSFEL